MNFSRSEEQDAIRDLARQILGDACTHERLCELERDPEGDGIDHVLWQALAEAHLLGVDIAEKDGGSGYGFASLSALLEEAGRALAPIPLIPCLATTAPAIERFGSEAQRQRWLPGLVAGEILLSAGLQEIGNFVPLQPATRARPQGDRWVLHGEKVCVPFADQAARILVAAAIEGGGLGVFLVDPRADGVEVAEGLSNNHERQFQLTLDGVELPADEMLGEPGSGAEIVNWIVERTQAALAAVQLGVCETALRKTAEYTSERKQFGRAIGTFQAVTMRIADAYVDLECMKSTLWQAVWRIDEGLPCAAEAAAAKWWSCRGGSRVAHTAMHLHGGIGADIDYPIHRHLLWAQQIGLTLGGAGEQLMRIGSLHAESGSTAAAPA
ncbi:MAG: acyl-CoA/acyl-ACP dehydrogenase [Myxococcota bacterium]|jgi:3-oxocholest-4-en-26-oyl-CoA dehydrogenase beta subunit|nr:acyl-CoA/acyl-ACP dehydrogenase [Myxococcota bacterium]